MSSNVLIIISHTRFGLCSGALGQVTIPFNISLMAESSVVGRYLLACDLFYDKEKGNAKRQVNDTAYPSSHCYEVDHRSKVLGTGCNCTCWCTERWKEWSFSFLKTGSIKNWIAVFTILMNMKVHLFDHSGKLDQLLLFLWWFHEVGTRSCLCTLAGVFPFALFQ